MKLKSWVCSLQGQLVLPREQSVPAGPEPMALSIVVTSHNCVSFARLDEEVLVIPCEAAQTTSPAPQQH